MLDAASEMGRSGVVIKTSGCAGLCSREPMLTVEAAGAPPVKYINLDPDKAEEIFRAHVLKGEVLEKHVLAMGQEKSF